MAKKTAEETALANITGSSFEQLWEMPEEEFDKAQKKAIAYQGKQVQLVSQMNAIGLQLRQLEAELQRSKIDPLVDSVAIKIKIENKKKEYQLANELFLELFPNQKVTPVIP